MATEKQIRANRNNASKSTGPRTGQGKTASSQNALKHGLLARDAVLPGEDDAEFEARLAALEADIQPASPLEHELVRQIADAQWRMRRLTRLETGYLAASLENARRLAKTSNPELLRPGYDGDTLLLGFVMCRGTERLTHFARYDAHLGRRFERAIQQISKLREAREKRESAAPNDAPRASTGPANSGGPIPSNGLDPQSNRDPDPPIQASKNDCETKPISPNSHGINDIAEEANPRRVPALQPRQCSSRVRAAAGVSGASSANTRRRFCHEQGMGLLNRRDSASGRLSRSPGL